jgi:hypothetical protein
MGELQCIFKGKRQKKDGLCRWDEDGWRGVISRMKSGIKGNELFHMSRGLRIDKIRREKGNTVL